MANSAERKPYRKLTLVPTDALERLRAIRKSPSNLDPPPPISSDQTAEPTVNTSFISPPSPIPPNAENSETLADAAALFQFPFLDQEKANQLVSLIPKSSLRYRVRCLLECLVGKIRLNDNLHIVYDDLQIGSHLLDLARFSAMPALKKKSSPSGAQQRVGAGGGAELKQPADIRKFMKIMGQLGVPIYCVPRLYDYYHLIKEATTAAAPSNQLQEKPTSRKNTAAVFNGPEKIEQIKKPRFRWMR